MECERPKCSKETSGDLLYCSEKCFERDNDPTPVTVVARNKVDGFGHDLHWSIPNPVVLPKES